MQKIVIIEPHPFHYVLFPGILRYFDILNFDYIVLVRNSEELRDALCLFPTIPKIIEFNNDSIEHILDGLYQDGYETVFFTSIEYFHDGIKESAYNLIKNSKISIDNIFGIQHNPDIIRDIHNDSFVRNDTIFTLSKAKYNDTELKTCCPTYVGKVSSRKIKYDMLLIGTSNDLYYIARQIESFKKESNLTLKIGVVGDMSKYLKKWLIKKVVSYFSFIIPELKKHNPMCSYKTLKNNFIYLGKTSFAEMYKAIEETKFINIGLNPEKSKEFYSGRTTGSILSAYAFNKPCVLHKHYANAYGLSCSNSVIYEALDDGGFDMVKNISSDEYDDMCENFKTHTEFIEMESVENLKKRIDK